MNIRSPKRGLSFKMILIIFANVAIITAIIFGYIYKVSRDTIYSNLKENSRLQTVSTVNQVEIILTSVQKVANNLAKVIEEEKFNDEKLQKMIQMILANNNEVFGAAIAFEKDYAKANSKFSTIYACRKENKIQWVNGDLNDFKDHEMDWYKIPRDSNRAMWAEPYMDEGGSNIVMSTYSVPLHQTINGKEKIIGLIALDISLDWFQKIVSSIKVYQTGYAYMVSQKGRMVTHPRKELIMNETIFSIAKKNRSEALKEIGRRMINGETSFAEVEYRNVTTGKLSWISYAPLKINGWSLGIVYPVEEFTSELNKLFTQAILLALVGAVILFIAIVLISRSITSPLRKLAFATQKFGEGSFDVELPKAKSKDEISDLTLSISAMQGALRQTIDQLHKANEELEEYSRTLEEKVETRTAQLKEKNNELDKAFENVKTLSQIGQEITSTLDLESIFSTVYENVNKLLDANSFLIMVVNQKENSLDCKLAIEDGKRLPGFSFSMNDKNRFAVWCADNCKPVFINDVDVEYSNYISQRSVPKVGTYVSSLIYLPLTVGERIIGVISTQSLNKNAYSENHLDILKNLAVYTASALENAFAYEKVNRANVELKEAQSQLIQAEKMASLGQLTAGIAHEIKNPLNFINNFSELSIDLSKELSEEIENQSGKLEPKSVSYINEILTDISHNVTKINEHGKRADSIVKGMLLHSRGKSGEKQKTNINDLLSEYLNLAFHGFRAQDSTFNTKMETDFDKSIEMINVVPQNISRVFLNIFNNGCYSVHEKKKEKKDGYDPVLKVATKNLGDKIEVTIRDNGKGIPQEVIDKVFNPFFTTKPAGKGTGLGLSLSYDIVVHEHKGDLKVNSEIGEFAEFVITIPKNL